MLNLTLEEEAHYMLRSKRSLFIFSFPTRLEAFRVTQSAGRKIQVELQWKSVPSTC